MKLLEGGNVFRDSNGIPATQRIDQTDIKPTVAWLEQLTGLPLLDNMLGTTGLKPSSGDLDLGVDSNLVSKDQLGQRLTRWVQSHGQEPKEWIRKSGISVHFKTPIAGNPDKGFVQTDFMFVPDLEYAKFTIASAPESEYRGEHRYVLISSVAKALGMRMNQTKGLVHRETGEVITNDPDEIARLLLNKNATRNDLRSVESIMSVLKTDPRREAKLADAREWFARNNLKLEEAIEENDTYFLARLRNRIVDCGMSVIVENKVLTEGARIEHPEDMVFDGGAQGARLALSSLRTLVDSQTGLSIKWDGKPAIVVGRDEKGFVLTDKSAFGAKGYDGIARSPDDIAKIMALRSGDRTELVEMYRKIWNPIRSLMPHGFKGFIVGDLLWTETPRLAGDHYVFTPNTVTYRVQKDSKLGRQIGASQVGIVFHTYVAEPGAQPQPWADVDSLTQVGSAVALDSKFEEPPRLLVPDTVFTKLTQFINKTGTAIDRLFDPIALRESKISSLPGLMKKYINHRVRTGNYANVASDFLEWLQEAAVNPKQLERVMEHIKANQQGYLAAFKVFIAITSLKENILHQLDRVDTTVKASIAGEPGHEGYVYSSPDATTKLVDRFKFSRANFERHAPEE